MFLYLFIQVISLMIGKMVPRAMERVIVA